MCAVHIVIYAIKCGILKETTYSSDFFFNVNVTLEASMINQIPLSPCSV